MNRLRGMSELCGKTTSFFSRRLARLRTRVIVLSNSSVPSRQVWVRRLNEICADFREILATEFDITK